jgi:fucose 4-O-acetylase-like acetyltransferase
LPVVTVTAPTLSNAVRDRSIDIAKGFAIIAIVLGHVLRGGAGADIVDGGGEFFDELDTALYAVHLPIFAFLSGIFVRRGVERSGRAVYLRSRLTLFAYLYVVWTVLQGGVKLVTGSLANSPLTVRGLIESLWRPDTQLWFLPFLAMVTLAAALVAPWRDRRRAVSSSIVAVAMSLTAWGVGGALVGTQGLGLVAFFWAGVVVGPTGLAALGPRAAVAVTVGGALFFAVLAFSDPVTATSSHEPRTAATVALGVIAATAGTVAALGLSQVLGLRQGAWLAFLGRRSLEIFLAHIIFTAATRIALIQFGVTAVAPHLALGTLIGICGPLALWWVGTRVGAPWLFVAPRTLTGPRGR